MKLPRVELPRRWIWWLLALFFTALAVSLLEAYALNQPGTEDACYYYSGGLNLSQGRGMSEYFYWNYLEGSVSLPHPGFLYWMPLPSLVAAAGMLFFHDGFRQAQIPFLLLSLAFPFWVSWLAYRTTASFRLALVSGFLSIFSGFYSVYWLNTESFLLFAWIGSCVFFALSVLLESPRWFFSLLTGTLCGLAHLTRADGILLLPFAGLAILIACPVSFFRRIQFLVLAGVGYSAVTGFWFLRNLRDLGSLFPSATGRALWLVSYNDLFHFPASDLTPGRFFSGGLLPLLGARWTAIVWNTETAVFVLGMVFLFPFICWGAYLLRKRPVMRIGILYFVMLFLVMSIVYPFQGSRGGFFHSSAALLPMAVIAAALGVDDIIQWLSRRRGWNANAAQSFFSIGVVLLALLSTAVVFKQRVIGGDPARSAWSSLNANYSIGVRRLGLTAAGTRVMVNDPPCFYAATGLEAVPIPDGDPATLLDMADRFEVRFIILDNNAPDGLVAIYNGTVTLARLPLVWEDREDGVLYRWFAVEPPPSFE
jgi:hypothetical protein